MQNIDPIYLDYAATTPVDQRVLAAMQPYFTAQFGNPSSVHAFGQDAENAVDQARLLMAGELGCQPGELVFTSCGTESDNLALRGVALAERERRGANHILIGPVEHHAVSHTAQQLARHFGFVVEELPVDEVGRTRAEDVAAALRPDTALVSLIFANNEIGTVNPIAAVGAICRARGVPLHTDAVQAAAHLPVRVDELGVDLLAVGAHKFYGPKGVGALYVRAGTPLLPTQTGGGQEGGRRAGTQNVPYLVGMAEAFRLAQRERAERAARLRPMRDHLIGRVLESIPDARLTGHPEERLPNHASFVFRGANGNTLLMLLDGQGIACSSGSACKTGSPEPSGVLTAIGLDREWALGSLRVTLGADTTPAHIERLLQALPGLVEQARRTYHP